MTTKHTPGPWRYHAKLSSSENHHGFHIRDAEGWALATVQPGDEDGNLGHVNARLIAAAPEMLEILEGFVRSSYVKQQHPKKYAMALAIIAKVGGRAP